MKLIYSESRVLVIKITRRNDNLRYAVDSTLMAENKDKQKNLLMRVKEESEKAGLIFNIQKTKIMVSFNFMAAVTVCSDFGAQENSLSLFPFFPPPYCHEVIGPDTMILVF